MWIQIGNQNGALMARRGGIKIGVNIEACRRASLGSTLGGQPGVRWLASVGSSLGINIGACGPANLESHLGSTWRQAHNNEHQHSIWIQPNGRKMFPDCDQSYSDTVPTATMTFNIQYDAIQTVDPYWHLPWAVDGGQLFESTMGSIFGKTL